MRNLPRVLPRFGAFDRFFDDLVMSAIPTVEPSSTPRLDTWEDENSYGLSFELPGFTLDEIELTVQDGELSLIARHDENLSEDSSAKELSDTNGEEPDKPSPSEARPARTWHRRERLHRHYVRRLQLPKDVDSSRAEAKLVNGVLELILPKTSEEQPKRIPVKG